MAVPDGERVAAVLAADADLEVGAGLAAQLHGHLHLLDDDRVEGLEGVVRQDLVLDVLEKEPALGVVAAVAERHLGQVVGAEAEELGVLGDLVRDPAGPRDLDHRAELVVDLDAALGDDRGGLRLQKRLSGDELVHVPDERDHDLRPRVLLGLLHGHGRVEDGPRLDLHEVRDHQAQAAAAQAEHRVLLVHRLDRREQLLVRSRCLRTSLGDLDQLLLEVREELVQRRVDEADDDRQAGHRREDALEVALLELLELGHGGVELGDGLLLLGGEGLAGGRLGLRAGGDVGHEDRAAHDLEARALAEHVLGAAQADALGAVGARLSGFLGLVGVGPDLQPADLVGHRQDGLKVLLVLVARVDRRQGADEDFAGGAVEADRVAFLDRGAVGVGALGGVVDFELRAAGHAGLADLASHDRGVRGRAALGGQDALGHGHAVEVVGGGLLADEDDLLALGGPGRGGVRVEDGLADRSARRGVQALGDSLRPWPEGPGRRCRAGAGRPGRARSRAIASRA